MAAKRKANFYRPVPDPELQEGEVFYGNVNVHYQIGIFPEHDGYQFDRIKWNTKRLGQVAYDRSGRVLYRSAPVFVKRAELVKAGVDPDALFPFASPKPRRRKKQ